jgi:phosphoglycerate kinase
MWKKVVQDQVEDVALRGYTAKDRITQDHLVAIVKKHSILNLPAEDIKDKVFFHRVDANVKNLDMAEADKPIRIIGSIKTDKHILESGGSLIISSHLQRPEGQRVDKFSIEKVAAKYKQQLIAEGVFTKEEADQKFVWLDVTHGSEVKEALAKAGPGAVVFLQNVQFDLGEISKTVAESCLKGKDLEKFEVQFKKIMKIAGIPEDLMAAGFNGELNFYQKDMILTTANMLADDYAKSLVKHADYVIQDGFGQMHREYASIAGIQKFRPSFAGILTTEEVIGFKKAQTPDYIIMGGSKEDKMEQLINAKAKKVFATGGLAHALIKAMGYDVSNNVGIGDDGVMKIAKELVEGSELVSEYKPFENIQLRRPDGTIIEIPGQVEIIESSSQKGFTDFFTDLDSKPRLQDDVKLMTVPVTEIEGDISIDTTPSAIDRFFRDVPLNSIILWNGPVGVADDLNSATATGSLHVRKWAERMLEADGFPYVGGGETGAITQGTKVPTSSGGGVLTKMAQGKPIYGVEAIGRYRP